MTPGAGAEMPVVQRTPDEVDLFSFSAAAWLLHRIHYDLPFTTDHDGHPGLLIHGPLQGTYMIQAASDWLGERASVRSITYRHKAPAYLGDTLECGGTITDLVSRTDEGDTFGRPVVRTVDTVTLDVWVRKPDGTVTTEGIAVFEVPR